MTGLRLLLILLLAFNLVCLGVVAMPWLGMPAPFMGSSEPERMQNQLAPEKLAVLQARPEPLPGVVQEASAPVAQASAALAEVSAPLAEASVPVVAQAAASAPEALASTQSSGPACVMFVKLTAVQAQALAQRAKGLGNGLSVSEEAPSPSSFWVNIPPQGGKAGADRRAAELKEIGLEDFFVVQEAGENRFAISLGLFKAESLAQRQLETLQKRGVKGAKVSARINPTGARVQMTGNIELIERVAREAAADIKGAEREACAG
jgi:SPOR domain